MRVVCKSIRADIRHNCFEIYKDPNITVDKSYEVLRIINYDHTEKTGLYMLDIIGNNGKCSYWSDYFYTNKELRKIKLEKLNETTK